MKKIISLLICILLLVTITIPAYATDINAIKPSNTTVIVGITNEDVPIHGTLPNTNAGTAIIIIAPGNEYQELQLTEEGIQAHNTIELDDKNEAEDVNTESVEDVEIPEDATLGEAIFLLTNQERLKEGLPTLSYNYELQDAADLRAKECAQQFSHTRPNGSSCHTVVEDFDYTVTGENLIKADKPVATAVKLVDAWMNSQGHRDNILLPEYTSLAIGVYETEDIIYAVQIFMG